VGYQRYEFLGNIGRDPELRHGTSGTAVCNFSVAVSEKYNGEESTTWIRCVAFGKTAETISQYLGKGSPILVTDSKMQNRSYEKDGETKYITEFIVRQFQFVGGGKGKQEPSHQENLDRYDRQRQEAGSSYSDTNDDSSDIPF
jgi:single-strand DNA-binding protein